METWDLLNENGEIITGKTVQADEDIPQGLYHLGSDVWFINSKNEILIQKRSSNKKKSPNVWAMTGGSVIKGENSIQTIIREVYEELGIRLDKNEMTLINHYKTGKVILDVYLVRKDINIQDIVIQEDEVSEVKWATYDEIEQIYEDGKFIHNRWEYVRDRIKEELLLGEKYD